MPVTIRLKITTPIKITPACEGSFIIPFLTSHAAIPGTCGWPKIALDLNCDSIWSASNSIFDIHFIVPHYFLATHPLGHR